MSNNRTVIIPHMGVSDQINLSGLIRALASVIPGTTIVTEQGNCKEMLQALYSDLSNVEVYSDTRLIPYYLFDIPWIVNQTRATGYIKIGYDTIDWSNEDYKNKSFIQIFYLSKNVPMDYRYTNFKIPDHIMEKSKEVYSEFVEKYGKDYIVIHEDPGHTKIIDSLYDCNRGSFQMLNREYMEPNLPIINLDQISKQVIDFYDVLCNAKEIHCIDSLWANFVYILTMTGNPAFTNKKVFLHQYARTNKNPLLYRNPNPPNWIYLE